MARELRVHLCRPERTEALRDELARVFPRAPLRSHPGRVDAELSRDDAQREVVTAFASQVLPSAQVVGGASVNALAAGAGETLALALAQHSGPWRLHAYALGETSGGRARLIADALDAWLAKKRRSLRRARQPAHEGPWLADEALVQLALDSSDRALLSVALPSARHRVRHTLSTFTAGACPVPRDKRPPSRAYQKLIESERRLHRLIQPGETVVDLGASPGGWSFVALERGAHVTAVDRSPLRDDLMENPHLRFVKGDAFDWHPDAPVDWLVCDLIAFPERTVELVEDWLSNRRCRRFVVTLKFRGSEDYPRVEAMKDILARHAGSFLLRPLDANKNEVTLMGEVRPLPPQAMLFDMDGVLVRSEEAWAHVVADAGAHFRGRAVTREEFAPTFGQGTQADIAAFGFSCSPAELDAFYASNFSKHSGHVWVNPEAAPLLERLRARGMPLAVVTNTTTPLAHEILRTARLDGFFRFVACADQVPSPKPAPDLVLHACQQLGVAPSSAWLVGDSRFDRGAAQAAHARFVGLGIDGDARIEALAELERETL